MTNRFAAAIAICSLVLMSAPAVMAGPNAHANAHAQGNGSNGGGNGNGNGNGNGGGGDNGGLGGSGSPHSVVRQYVLANPGLKQGQVASSLKSWNSLNANPKAFLNNLDNPNSLLGKEAAYICASSTAQSDLTKFNDLVPTGTPPSPDEVKAAQDFLTAETTLGTLDPQKVVDNPNLYPDKVAAAKLLLANLKLATPLTDETAQATIDAADAWTAYQKADASAAGAFATASVSYKGSTDLTELRKTVDAIIAQKGLDTTKLCATSTASAQ